MIRLGVMGFGGRISSMINHVFREVEPDIRVVGIVDPDEEGARSRLAECDKADAVFYTSTDEMVRQAKPDALAVGTRCNLHTPYAVEAARYDLPLFLEKPVATSMEQATALEDAFAASRCQAVVSFPLRVSPLCVLTRQYIDEGAVGPAEHILGVNYVPYGTCYFDGHYRNFAVTQGLFLQKATHDFDYMSYLMGSTIIRVAATAQYGRVFGAPGARGKGMPAGLVCSQCDDALVCLESPENRKRNGSGGTDQDHPCVFGVDCGSPEAGMNEDASNALLQFANGAAGVYTQVFYSRRDSGTRGSTISGYHGTLSFDWYTNELKRVRHHAPFSDTIRAGGGMSHFGGDHELSQDFIGLIRGRCKSRTPIETGIQSVYTCLAAKESAETGRFVDVRQVGSTPV
ncbi:MAG TPA: Gfo/Idh/MocA family oxidoreductase [Armatimonadota bacterium]|nr:Gfo/Idh/MocA family oxidoreductase [Armatimonadota bacterium]